jgi:hypothetical protein
MTNKPETVEIGYLCGHGHYIFYGIGENACGSKRVAALTIVPEVEYSKPFQCEDADGHVYYTDCGYNQEDWDRTLEGATFSQKRRQEAWENS